MGNVLATITDNNVQHSTDGSNIDYYNADISTAQEYYAFGGLMPGRTFTEVKNYRYGFNGKENDNEVKGVGNQIDYGSRIYDPRTVKFYSVDPIGNQYPWYTPYSFAGNNPIENIDLDGEEEYHYTLLTRKDGSAYLKPSSPPILYNDHITIGKFVLFQTLIQGKRYVVTYGSNSYYIGFASDKGRTNNFKMPLFKQFLNAPSVDFLEENFDDVKQSRLNGFFQDMQTSVAATLIAHELIVEGQTRSVGSNIPTLREGSGPVSGVIEVSPNVKSVAQFNNYKPATGVEFVFDPKTNTFAVGNVNEPVAGLSPHQNLAKAIGASPDEVVGGIFKRGENGEIITNEQSGHYYRNWTPKVREQFVKFLESTTGQKVNHVTGQ